MKVEMKSRGIVRCEKEDEGIDRDLGGYMICGCSAGSTYQGEVYLDKLSPLQLCGMKRQM